MLHHLTTDTLIDYIHGELAPAQDATVHAHLQTCQSCRTEYQSELALGDLLRSAAAAEEFELPGMVRARIWEEVRALQPGPLDRLRTWLRPALAVPAALAILVGVYFVSPLAHREGPLETASISAGYYLGQHAASEAENPIGERTDVEAGLETSFARARTSPPLIEAVSDAAIDTGR